MNNSRTAGVLLHLTSLNGDFGVGVMGEEAYRFVDKLKRMSFSLWQMLPLNPPDDTGSPYCSVSAFAGNLALIDPRQLFKEGLVSESDVNENKCTDPFHTAAHKNALSKRLTLLKKAYSNLDEATKQPVELFSEQNPWVKPYALFMSLKKRFNDKPWWEWGEEFRSYENALKRLEELENEPFFYAFSQYVFFTQFRSLKEYANKNGIEILGDMPIYVSLDSVDVWSNPDLFKLDEKTNLPTEVAGVPPDYFSKDGQLWGNPLYDWDKMEKDGFSWWLKRIEGSQKLFDRVRIDHFRAFASYWAVPAESETAKLGVWKKGPGMKLFSAVEKALPEANIIAEDLGLFGEDVEKLLSDSGFPGMRVIQFGFDPDGNSSHLPHNYDKNCVAYVGTHDNNTILGWLWEASEKERNFALRYCCFGGKNWGDGGFYSGSCRAVIEAVFRSSANTAIVAIQDLCGYGCDARMNTPGTSENNWGFRISGDALNSIDEEYCKQINQIYKRNNIKE